MVFYSSHLENADTQIIRQLLSIPFHFDIKGENDGVPMDGFDQYYYYLLTILDQVVESRLESPRTRRIGNKDVLERQEWT